MGFNYGLEKKRFDAKWIELRMQYRAAGMDETSIEAMHAFDWNCFNKERAYRNHTQGLPEQQFDDDGDSTGEDNSALLDKHMDRFAVPAKETDDRRRYSWLDEIDSTKLAAALHRMSPEDIELLTLYAIDGYSVTEIARMQGVSHPTISKKLKRMKNFFKKF